MPPLLEVRQLAVAYGGLGVLEGIDLAVPEGGLVGILGPNGAGKSTLLKTISGLLRPASGEILLRGRRLDGRPPSEIARRGVCLIPEGRGIFPSLTVAENLRVMLGEHPAAHDAARSRFPLLADRLEQPAATLSGGEQQMLALVRAVAADPALLMVDEPTLGLAPRIVREITDLIGELHRDRGRTILLVEQHVGRVLELADLVYVLNRGGVVWAGEPGELRHSRVLAESYLGSLA